MSVEVKITNFHIDENLLYRTMTLRALGKEMATPVKAVNPSQLRSGIQIRREPRGLVEIHKDLYEQTQYFQRGTREGERRIPSIEDLNREPSLQERFESGIDYLRRRSGSQNLVLCMLRYVGEKYPGKMAIEYLCDISYVFSDIVPVPAVFPTREISCEEDFLRYLSWLKSYFEILETHNNKPIMGIVPNIGRIYFDSLFDFYRDRGLNCFYFDFEGKSPLSRQTNIRKFLRLLCNEDMLENSFLHATNVYSGRFLRKLETIRAKDILSFGLGFDSMGRNKRKPPPPDFVREQMKPTSKLRLFNKEDYGYYQIASKDMSRIYPSDTNIPLEAFSKYGDSTTSRRYDLQNNFNMEQQILEAIRLRGVVRKDSPEEYLRGKHYVAPQDLELMKKVSASVQKRRGEEAQRTLF